MDLTEHKVQLVDTLVSERISNVIATKPLADWIKIFDETPCCVSPVNTVDEALNTVAARERNVLTYLEHPTLGQIPQIASPMLNKQERRHMCTPVATMDNEALKALKELGYTSKQIKRLESEKIIELRHVSES